MEQLFEAYDENDIEDFEEYLQYYGFEDEAENDDDEYIECDRKELYF